VDKLIATALHDALVAQIDAYLLEQMVAAGGSTSGASSYSAQDFFQDVASAQAAVATGAGIRLPATHAFTQPQLAQWLLSQSDGAGRPLLIPIPQQVPTAVKLTATGGAAPGYSGTTLLGSHFFSDGNLADVAGSSPLQSPVVFANTPEVFIMVSEPSMRVMPFTEATAPDLSVLRRFGSEGGMGSAARRGDAAGLIA
jgi:hypothetical protein